MNFYDIECPLPQADLYEQPQEQLQQEYIFEDQQLAQPEKLDTFSGYLQEEPIMYFNYVEEAPKKKTKPIIRKTKKIKKADSETDACIGIKKLKQTLIGGDLAKLQQCQMLKTVISQMEMILQNTRAQILNEFLKQHQDQ